MTKSNRQFIDRLGIITSGICALHCAAIPILISFGLIGSMSGVMHDFLELSVIVMSGFLAVFSIYNGLNGHGRLHPQLAIGAGASSIVFGYVVPTLGHGFMAFGGALLLYGHWLNWRQLSIQD